MNIYAILAPMSERTVLFFCHSVYWREAGPVCLSEEAVVRWKSSGRFVCKVRLMMIATECVSSWGGGGQLAACCAATHHFSCSEAGKPHIILECAAQNVYLQHVSMLQSSAVRIQGMF